MSEHDRLRRKELGAFLRSRRERITPEDVDLPVIGRRRTPGLRREEVALLAGVGVTWYTWLEQGRDINVSVQVLDAVARTLRLDPHERSHLLTLASADIGASPVECQSLPPATQTILDRLQPYPAYVSNPRMDILAFNQSFAHLCGNLNVLPADDRNVLWLMFTNPAWRAAIPEWDMASSHTVGRFRAEMAKHVGEPGWKALENRLKAAAPEFAELWSRNIVAPNRNQLKEIVNPHVGRLHLEHTWLWLSDNGGHRMVTYTPTDDQTRARLEQLGRYVEQLVSENA